MSSTCTCQFQFPSSVEVRHITRLHCIIYLGPTGWDDCWRMVSLIQALSALRELLLEVVWFGESSSQHMHFLDPVVQSLRIIGRVRELVVCVRGSMTHSNDSCDTRISERKDTYGEWRPYPRDDSVVAIPWIRLSLYKASGGLTLRVY